MIEQLSAQDCTDIGITHLHKGNFEEATSYFEKALELDPAAYGSMNQLGLVALQDKDDDLAVKWWLKSVDIEENIDALSNLGFFYSKAEQLEKAKPYLKRATEINPNQVDAIIQWAFIEMTEGNFTLAEELLEPLLTHDVAFEEAHLMLSQVKVEQKLSDEAIEVLEKLIEQYPDSLQGYHQLAKLNFVSKNYEASDKYYGLLLKAIPNHLDLIKEYGVLLRDHVSTKRSIDLFQNTLAMVSNDWELHCHLALSLETANKPERALQSYSNAIALNPNDLFLKQKVAQLEAKVTNS